MATPQRELGRNPGSTLASPLRSRRYEITGSDGKHYYANARTKQTQWNMPAEVAQSQADLAALRTMAIGAMASVGTVDSHGEWQRGWLEYKQAQEWRRSWCVIVGNARHGDLSLKAYEDEIHSVGTEGLDEALNLSGEWAGGLAAGDGAGGILLSMQHERGTSTRQFRVPLGLCAAAWYWLAENAPCSLLHTCTLPSQ